MYILSLKVISEPIAEPVSVSEAKAWMKVSFNTDDTIIGVLVGSARRMLERYTGLSLASKTYELICEAEKYIVLPYGPVSSITAIEKLEVFDDDYLLEADDYVQRGDRLEVYESGDYKVTYVCVLSPLPEDIKTDILRLVAWMYQNRGIQFSEADITNYPDWQALSATRYQKVIV